VVLCALMVLSSLIWFPGFAYQRIVKESEYYWVGDSIAFTLASTLSWIGCFLVSSFFLRKAITFKLVFNNGFSDKMRAWDCYFVVLNIFFMILLAAFELTATFKGWKVSTNLLQTIMILVYTVI
jgi:hypothetical protein